MKVALIGASGNAGSRILAEPVGRGHTVTAIARDAARTATGEGVRAVTVNLHNDTAIKHVACNHDAVITRCISPQTILIN